MSEQTSDERASHEQTSHEQTSEPDGGKPFFPVPAPAQLKDPDVVAPALAAVLDRLAEVVGATREDQLSGPTPCTGWPVGQLRDHVLGWLDFFAAALTDPAGRSVRPDPAAYRAESEDRDLAGAVQLARQAIVGAVRSGVLDGEVTVSQARMSGPSVAGMYLGEYLLHGWDLAVATGRAWQPPEATAELALAFFQGMILPEYRGAEGGFFGPEVAVAADAPVLDRLLGFAGRDPGWRPGR